MVRVCVVGGGTAGAEAAREAAEGGAEVTVLEKSANPGPPWKSWPDLVLRGPRASDGAASRSRMPSGAEVLPLEAKSLDSGSVLSSAGPLTHFDAVVAATGSGFTPITLPGHRKPGVHELRSAAAYADLGRIRGTIHHPVVSGEGARALEVADRLSGSGREVQVVISHWRHGEPSPDVQEVLRQAADDRGVEMMNGNVTRAAGEGSVEAVVVGGRVACCDSLVLLPDRIPRVIPAAARLGRGGGFFVDRSLRTSSPAIFAAGGCAEVCERNSRPSVLEDEPGTTGRIAGANSLGRNLTVGPSARSEVVAFGLRWTRVEARFGRSYSPAFPHGVVSRRWDTDSACTITFERLRGRALRIESIGDEGTSRMQSPPSSLGEESLRSLAYGGSSDISLVSDTARLGLRLWSNS